MSRIWRFSSSGGSLQANDDRQTVGGEVFDADQEQSAAQEVCRVVGQSQDLARTLRGTILDYTFVLVVPVAFFSAVLWLAG